MSTSADQSKPVPPVVVWKQVVALCCAVTAFAMFAVGMLSPLTPSEGRPSVLAVTVFLGGPLALLTLSYSWATSGVARFVLAMEALFILLVSALFIPWK